MSCIYSDNRPPREKYRLTTAQAIQLENVQQSLHFSDRQIARLYKVFTICDFDKNNTVDKPEFLAWIDEPLESGFAHQCFSLNDHDKSHTMDFMEFLGVVYNYCSLSKEGLIKFAFALVDKDGSGHLTMDEIEELVHMVYGVHLSASENGVYKAKNMTDVKNAMTVVRNLDKDKSGDISLHEFARCAQVHPFLLFPAFQLQEKVRRRAGGQDFWEKTVSVRKHLSVEDVELINQLRNIERQNSCPDVTEKKAKRKEYRDKKRAMGEVGPNEKKMNKRLDRLKARGDRPGLERKSSFQQLKDLTRRKKKGKDTIHPDGSSSPDGGINAYNVRQHPNKKSKKAERAEKERLKQQEERQLQEEEAARSWAASHGNGPS